jgi:single-strand DNA-binding protein
MADLNHVVLVGRLTRDAELKYTATGQAVSKFSLAVGRRRKNGDEWVDETSYFDIVLWGKTAETLNQYLVKGKQVGVDGELRQERWEQDGQSRSKVSITANNVQLLGTSGSGTQGSSSMQSPKPSSVNPQKVERKDYDSHPVDDGFSDDIPF